MMKGYDQRNFQLYRWDIYLQPKKVKGMLLGAESKQITQTKNYAHTQQEHLGMRCMILKLHFKHVHWKVIMVNQLNITLHNW